MPVWYLLEGMTWPPQTAPPRARPHLEHVRKAIARRSFCTLATASATNRPHVAGVLYVTDGDILYVNTSRTSRKARNISENPCVFVCIPVRRLPLGPPSTVQFSATADLLAITDPDILRLADTGGLKAITSHGELDMPDSCFIRILPAPKLHTYGLGLPLRHLIRDPLNASGHVNLPEPQDTTRRWPSRSEEGIRPARPTRQP